MNRFKDEALGEDLRGCQMVTLLVNDDALGEADGDLGLIRLRCAAVGRLGWQREGIWRLCLSMTLEEAIGDLGRMSYGCLGFLERQPGRAVDKLPGLAGKLLVVAKKICSDGE